MRRKKRLTSNSRTSQKLKISWAWNSTFLKLSGSRNNAEPFLLFQAPETDKFWRFPGPEIVKKALFYFLDLNSSKRCNFRPRKLQKGCKILHATLYRFTPINILINLKQNLINKTSVMTWNNLFPWTMAEEEGLVIGVLVWGLIA
jgi:hypothetical protein